MSSKVTGTGLSVVSLNDSVSYNRSVNTINVHQKDNVEKLESALVNANRNNDALQESLAAVRNTIKNVKKQVFMNQCLIDNWNRNPPYAYPTNMLQ